MILTSLRAYNFKLCPEQKAVNICFIHLMKGTKQSILLFIFKSIIHFDRILTKL